MEKPWPILMNARAGSLRSTATEDQMRRMASESGLEARVILTHSPEGMRQTVRRLMAEGVTRIAVAGGDGTVSIAAREMANTDAVLGILPQGTFNNFATALRLPQDLPSALRVLIEGEETAVSLGRVDGHYFTEVAGVGLFADALDIYGSETNKNLARGLYAMLTVLAYYRAHRIRVVADGQELSQRSVLCAVANTYRMAQAVPVAPMARLTDEELDVVIIGDLSRRELLPYYRALRAQVHLSLPKVTHLRAREIRIESVRPVPVHADDQVVGNTPVTVTVEPGALKVMVDRL